MNKIVYLFLVGTGGFSLIFGESLFQKDYCNSFRRIRVNASVEETARLLLQILRDNPEDPLFYARQLISLFPKIKNPQLKEEILQSAVINLFSHKKADVRHFALDSAYKFFSSIDTEEQKTNLLLKAVPLSIDVDYDVASYASLLIKDKILNLRETAQQEKVLALYIKQFGKTNLNNRMKMIAEVLKTLSKKLNSDSLENLSAVLLYVLLTNEHLRPSIDQVGPEFDSLFPASLSLRTFLSVLGMLAVHQKPQADLKALIKSQEKIKPFVLLWLYELNLTQGVNKYDLAWRIVNNFSDEDLLAYKALSFYALARLSLPKNTPKELKSKIENLVERYTADPYLKPLIDNLLKDIS
ncbi:MAG: hypothetical protein NC898_05305 [Candidatus Omnitrophica bacterium]|nr:hypothetical protein [Candidatus Omnitrophota bacterium]MCM8793859.1 hypothetical protein [Candidatus Omnitrophota bacterium]